MGRIFKLHAAAPAVSALLAAVPLAFTSLFILQNRGLVDFWWAMSGIITGLMTLILLFDGTYRTEIFGDLKRGAVKKIALGAGSAPLLYGIFALGNAVSRIVLPFAGHDIGAVYLFREGASELRIALLMVLVIGPGEELLWRGFFQRRLSIIAGDIPGYIGASVVYAAVHAFTGNAMLVLAALTCGLFWGFIYQRTRSLLVVCVSHTLWDILVFIVFPFAR